MTTDLTKVLMHYYIVAGKVLTGDIKITGRETKRHVKLFQGGRNY